MSKRKKNKPLMPALRTHHPKKTLEDDLSSMEQIPVTYQDLTDYFSSFKEFTPFLLRKETFLRIERITGVPLICYVTKTHNLPKGVPSYIDDEDLTGFGDLTHSTRGEAVDVFLVSNGGSAEATERIVRLLREHYSRVRFILPANAFSAATLLCFSGEEIIMDSLSTLGPIDPQINGVPARAILRAFESVEARLKDEGPKGLTAYMPLISKYELHILEICKSAQELSKELARNWLSTYMLKCDEGNPKLIELIDFFLDYDVHKSHGRSIDRQKAREVGLTVINSEEIEGLAGLIRSLYNQYEIWFDKTPSYKLFENSRGINWGREIRQINIKLPVKSQ